MMMRNILFLFILSVSVNVWSEDFHSFNKRVFYANTDFSTSLKAERDLYKSTKDVSHYYRAKYIESFIYGKQNDSKRRLKTLVWLEDNCKDEALLANVQFHMAYFFKSIGIEEIGLKYSLKALSSKKMDPALQYEVYSLVATSYYKLKDFKKAGYYFEKALQLFNGKNKLNLASCYNNIGLCAMETKQTIEAEYNFTKAINLLNSERFSQENADFLVLVQGNLGSLYFQNKEYDKAIDLLEIRTNVALDVHDRKRFNTANCLELLCTYELLNEHAKRDVLLRKLYVLAGKESDSTQAPAFTQNLYDYYIFIGEINKAGKISKELFQRTKAHQLHLDKRNQSILMLLYDDKLENIKLQIKGNSLLNGRSLAAKDKTNTLYFILLLVMSISITLGYLVYRNRRNIRIKDSLIAKQQHEITVNENLSLEEKNKLHQNQINSLVQFQNLKSATEKVFLLKLKEIKRTKNVVTSQVVQELQLMISNILDIDKKMVAIDVVASETDTNLRIKLAQKHASLTEIDIDFCCLFQMKLSAKEIGIIRGLSDVSIRVVKHKIKHKIGLNTYTSLNEYLSNL